MLENMPEDARKQLEWLINAIMKHFYLLFKYNKIDYVTEGSIAGLWDPNTTPAEEQKLFMKDLEKIYGSEIKSVNDILRALSTAVIKLADVITSKKFPEDGKTPKRHPALHSAMAMGRRYSRHSHKTQRLTNVCISTSFTQFFFYMLPRSFNFSSTFKNFLGIP